TYEMMPVGRNVTRAAASRPPAASAAGMRSAWERSGRSCQAISTRGMPSRMMRAGFADTSATSLSEQSLRPEQQYEDHQYKSDAGTVGGIEEQGRHLPGDPDYERTCECTVRVAYRAEDDSSEERQEQEPAHFRAQLRVQAVHDARHAGEPAADQPGP